MVNLEKMFLLLLQSASAGRGWLPSDQAAAFKSRAADFHRLGSSKVRLQLVIISESVQEDLI